MTGHPRPQRGHPELGRCPVVGKHEHRVQIRAREEVVIRAMGLDPSVRVLETRPQPGIWIGGGHELANHPARHGGQIAPYMVVAETGDAHAEACHAVKPTEPVTLWEARARVRR